MGPTWPKKTEPSQNTLFSLYHGLLPKSQTENKKFPAEIVIPETLVETLVVEIATLTVAGATLTATEKDREVQNAMNTGQKNYQPPVINQHLNPRKHVEKPRGQGELNIGSFPHGAWNASNVNNDKSTNGDRYASSSSRSHRQSQNVS